MKHLQIQSNQEDYPVWIGESVAQAIAELTKLPKAIVFIDANVDRLYTATLAPLKAKFPFCLVTATEEEKSLEGMKRCLDFMQSHNCTKADRIIAIGGGIVQDLISFAAHIYYRGLKWILVPTTLLSMGDSCIGAKSGLNLNSFKNQIGAFHAPESIYICSEFIQTLTDADIASGYGEIFKLFLVGGGDYPIRLQGLLAGGLRQAPAADLIFDSLWIKKRHIEEDEYDVGIRRYLNYGHTFGHALESIVDHEIPHGLAVVFGIDLINFLAQRWGILSAARYENLHRWITEQFGFRLSKSVTADALINKAKRDKKVVDGRLNLALLADNPKALQGGDHPTMLLKPITFEGEIHALLQEYLQGPAKDCFHLAG